MTAGARSATLFVGMSRSSLHRSRPLQIALAALALSACGQSRGVFDPADMPGATGAAGTTGALQSCDGFPMPNPARVGLPNPAKYTRNADGTITDDVTGLTWDGRVEDVGLSEQDGAAQCAAKGEGWRLPTRLELVSLVDYTVPAPGPTIDAIFEGTPGAIFWTSSIYAGDVGDAWTVGFDAGYSDYGLRETLERVRCVRPPPAEVRCRPTRFETRQSEGVVRDLATGLTWEHTLDTTRMFTWDESAARCAARGPGWRVPSLTELQTIIDDAREYPAIDESIFPGTPRVVFWTSTPHAESVGTAWYVDFFYGATDADVRTRAYQVRCVR
jgi:hypothetical protein